MLIFDAVLPEGLNIIAFGVGVWPCPLHAEISLDPEIFHF